MKFLIAGLGNIGSEYKNTRHNIGFEVVDAFAKASTVFFEPGRYADVAQCKIKNREFILIKPTTFMNLSGKAVRYWLQHEKIPLENLLVVTDDIALPVGKLRLRGKGSDGGHNGLKSINELLETNKYPRLRFGVGNDFPKGQQVSHVLGQWTPKEREILDDRIKLASDLIYDFAFQGLAKTMSTYNSK